MDIMYSVFALTKWLSCYLFINVEFPFRFLCWKCIFLWCWNYSELTLITCLFLLDLWWFSDADCTPGPTEICVFLVFHLKGFFFSWFLSSINGSSLFKNLYFLFFIFYVIFGGVRWGSCFCVCDDVMHLQVFEKKACLSLPAFNSSGGKPFFGDGVWKI